MNEQTKKYTELAFQKLGTPANVIEAMRPYTDRPPAEGTVRAWKCRGFIPVQPINYCLPFAKASGICESKLRGDIYPRALSPIKP